MLPSFHCEFWLLFTIYQINCIIISWFNYFMQRFAWFILFQIVFFPLYIDWRKPFLLGIMYVGSNSNQLLLITYGCALTVIRLQMFFWLPKVGFCKWSLLLGMCHVMESLSRRHCHGCARRETPSRKHCHRWKERVEENECEFHYL